MDKLKIFVDKGPRSSLSRRKLRELSINYEELNVEANQYALEFLINKDRPPKKFPLPQFYVGNQLVWENGFKDFVNLTEQEIIQRIEEINAANT